MKNKEFTILSFYQFIKVSNSPKLQSLLKEFCRFNKLKGTILIAPEGINGSIGGLYNSIKLLKIELLKLRFNSLNTKFSTCSFMPFYRLKIKIKKEIVTFSPKKLNV